MPKIFDKAIAIAQKRAEWEFEVNSKGEAWTFVEFSPEQLEQSQSHIDSFQAAMQEAAQKASFSSVEAAKAELQKLDYEKEYIPLWRFAESCMPINEQTKVLAQALAPARLGAVERVRAGLFGVYEPQEEHSGVLVHKAVAREESSDPTRGDAARELAAKRSAEHAASFKSIAEAMAHEKLKGRSVGSAVESLGKLPGKRVVEGEASQLAAVDKKGQAQLFTPEEAPEPPKPAKARKPKK